MTKHGHALLALGTMLIVFLGAPCLAAEPTAPTPEAAPPTELFLFENASPAPASTEEALPAAEDLFAPEATAAGCTFCNPSGYLVCQNADGTACGVPGQFRRCIVAPVCYCEWGGCNCQNGVWNCFW